MTFLSLSETAGASIGLPALCGAPRASSWLSPPLSVFFRLGAPLRLRLRKTHPFLRAGESAQWMARFRVGAVPGLLSR